MKLNQIKPECFILALFIRDDNERFLLGTGAYEFKDGQKHFAANTFSNDVVEVQGNDGAFLAGQVRRAATQVFDGYVGNGTTSKEKVEEYRRDFLAFFRKAHYYTVVYVFSDGTSIQRRRGYIVDAPEVKELYQMFPEYHIGLNFEDVNYYSYDESEDGEEAYSKSAIIKLSAGATSGGLVWDEEGVVWDGLGAVWEDGEAGGPTTVMVNSIDIVYPVWTVPGPAENPILSDLTTNTTITYNGNVAEGQTLVVNMFDQTALLNGTSVIENITGDWIYLSPGINKIVYTAIVPAPPPPAPPVIGDLEYMQDFATLSDVGMQSVVASMVEEQVYTLKDSRDQQDYPITKAKGGFVLMCKNLRIGSNDEETVLKAADSDFEGEDITLPQGNATKFMDKNSHNLRIDETYGGYYAFYTATAEKGTTEFTGNANQSILPKGWTLMTPEQVTQLILAYGGDNAQGSAALQAAPLNIQLGGRYYQGEIGLVGQSAWQWTSSSPSANIGQGYCLNATRAYVRGGDDKSAGLNIRGILRTGGGDMRPIIEQLTYMQDVTICDFDTLAASMELEKVYTLIDKRDGTPYKITLLPDGNIAMAEEFKGKGFTCHPDDSNVSEDYTLPESSLANFHGDTPALYENNEGYVFYNTYCALADGKGDIAPLGWELPPQTYWDDFIAKNTNYFESPINIVRKGVVQAGLAGGAYMYPWHNSSQTESDGVYWSSSPHPTNNEIQLGLWVKGSNNTLVAGGSYSNKNYGALLRFIVKRKKEE